MLETADVVGDQERTSMRSQDQVMLARVNLDIEHWNRRHAVLRPDFAPVSAAIEGNKQTKLGTREQQIRIHWILAHRVDRTGFRRDAVGYARPGRPEILGDVEIDRIIAATMIVESHVRGALFLM